MISILRKSGKIPLGKISTSPFWYSISLFGSKSYAKSMKNFVEKGFGTNPFVYMVVKKIAEVASRLPYKLQDNNGKPVDSGEIYDLLQKPNQNQWGNEFMENVFQELLTTGNAFIKGVNVVGTGYNEMTVLRSKDTEILLNNINEVKGYKYYDFGTYAIVEPENILHLKFPNIVNTSEENQLYGLSPIESAMMVYNASNNIFEAEAFIFENRGVTGILSNDTEVPILNPERERLQKDWQAITAGSKRFGKILVSNSKLKYHQLSMTPTDLKLIETSINKLRIICSIYGVDSSLFNDPANKTYNNRSEAQKAFYTDVVIPLATIYIKNLNVWLVQGSFKSDNKIVIDKDEIEALRIVNKELSDKVIAELNIGILTVQEAREKLGYENQLQ